MLAEIGVLFCGLALILDSVGVAVPDWFYWSLTVEGRTATIKFGLWKCCTDVPPLESECFSLEVIETSVSEKIRATRGLEIISLLLITMSGGLAVFKIRVKKDQRRILQASAIMSCVAGLLTTVGAIVFIFGNTIKTYLEENSFRGQVNMEPHTGFAMCIVSGLFCFVAALLYYIDTCWRKNTVQNVNC